MKKPQTVRLITGKVVPHDLVPLVGLVLQDLNTRDPRMLRELVRAARDPTHQAPEDVASVFLALGLIDAQGSMTAPVRDTILASVTGDEVLAVISPIWGDTAPWRPRVVALSPYWTTIWVDAPDFACGYTAGRGLLGRPEFLAFGRPHGGSKEMDLFKHLLDTVSQRWDEALMQCPTGGGDESSPPPAVVPLGVDLYGHLAYDDGTQRVVAPIRLMQCPAGTAVAYAPQAAGRATEGKRPLPAMIQVVLQDERGRWPWEDGCIRPQRLLGEVALGTLPQDPGVARRT